MSNFFLFLQDHFATCRIHDSQGFSLNTWNPSGLHGFWWEIHCSSYWRFLVHNECLLLQLLRSSPSFGSLTVLCLEFIRFGVHWAFRVCRWMFIIKHGKLLVISSSNILSFLCSPFGTPVLPVLVHWMVFHKTEVHWTFSILFIFCFLDQNDWPVSMFALLLAQSAFEPLWWFHLPHTIVLNSEFLFDSFLQLLFLFGTLLLGQTSFSL